MKIILIFLLGLGILIGAIILNTLASKLSLTSWFEFLKNPTRANSWSYIWLFLIYPFGLGIIAYFIAKLIKL